MGKARRITSENSKMLCGHWLGYILSIIGYSGYSGYYSSELSDYYWIAALGLGMALLLITSINYFNKARMNPLQLMLGLILICSVYLLPTILPFMHELNVLIGYAIAFGAMVVLNLKFWRHTWE